MIKIDFDFEQRVRNIEKKKTIASTINYMYKKYSHNPSIVELLGQLSKEVSDLGGNLYDDSHRKYLSEIIIEEPPEFKNENLIISPIGSGKSTFIEKVLIDPNKKDWFLYLNDGTPSNGISYSSLQIKLNEDDNFLSKFKCIICDDFDKAMKNNSFVQILDLIREQRDVAQIFYLSSDGERILENVNVIDYRENEIIKKYVEINRTEIPDLCGLDNFFNETEITKDSTYNYKGIAIGDSISDLVELEKNIKSNGLNTIMLWTKKNSSKKLSKEQIETLKYIEEMRRIPPNCDILILTKEAFKELKFDDFKIKYAIINKSHDTDNILRQHKHCVNLVVYNSICCVNDKVKLEHPMNTPFRTVTHKEQSI